MRTHTKPEPKFNHEPAIRQRSDAVVTNAVRNVRPATSYGGFEGVPLFSTSHNQISEHVLSGMVGQLSAASESDNQIGAPVNSNASEQGVAARAEPPENDNASDPQPVALEEQPQPQPQGPVVKPLQISQSDKLWWFNGVNAANFSEQVTLRAGVPGATGGTFRWDIIQGGSRVDFSNGQDGITKLGTNLVSISSTAASTTASDVRVRCSWNAGYQTSTLFHNLSVLAPNDAVAVGTPSDVSTNGYARCSGQSWCEPDNRCWAEGYRTTYTMRVVDQFGTTLPDQVELNETFGTFTDDYTGQNWPTSSLTTAPTWTTSSSQFDDDYGLTGCKGQWTPDPVSPTDANAGVKVVHSTQVIRAGSLTAGSGRPIKTQTVQFHRGKGRRI